MVEHCNSKKKCVGENTQRTTCSREQMRNTRGGLSSIAATKALVPVVSAQARNYVKLCTNPRLSSMNEKSYCNSETRFLLGWRGPFLNTLETPRCVDNGTPKTSLNPTYPSNKHPTRHTILNIALVRNENCDRAVRHSGAYHWVGDGGSFDVPLIATTRFTPPSTKNEFHDERGRPERFEQSLDNGWEDALANHATPQASLNLATNCTEHQHLPRCPSLRW